MLGAISYSSKVSHLYAEGNLRTPRAGDGSEEEKYSNEAHLPVRE